MSVVIGLCLMERLGFVRYELVVTERRSMGVMTVIDDDGNFRSFGFKDGVCTGEWT